MPLAETITNTLQLYLQGTTLEGVVEGGFHNTPLIRKGPGATPEAFDTAGVPKVSVVVLDPALAPGVQAFEVPDDVEAQVIVWFYGPDSAEGRATLQQLRTFVYTVMTDEDLTLPTSSEHIGFPLWSGDLEIRRNHEEFQASVIANIRFVVVHQRERMVL